MPHSTNTLRACRRCGLVQRVQPPPTQLRLVARCDRCNAPIPLPGPADLARTRRMLSRTAALSAAALILYPLSMALPVLEVERLGHQRSATILSGVVDLWREGYILIATLVFTCSVFVPLVKITGMFTLCAGGTLLSTRDRAHAYRFIDLIGRWGMIDVLLVAILVAAVKLGNWVSVHPGPGVAAFAAVVVLSMISWASFNPDDIWERP